MTIYFGSDHRGFELKSKLIDYLGEKGGYQIVDLGAENYNENDDYVDFGVRVGESVVRDEGSLGVVLCATGVGISIAANKVKGVRCGLCWHKDLVFHSKQDDDINVLAIPSEYVTLRDTKEILDTFLNTKFKSEQRYIKRIEKMNQFEQQQMEKTND